MNRVKALQSPEGFSLHAYLRALLQRFVHGNEAQDPAVYIRVHVLRLR